MKRLLSVFIAFIFIIGAVPSFADSENQGEAEVLPVAHFNQDYKEEIYTASKESELYAELDGASSLPQGLEIFEENEHISEKEIRYTAYIAGKPSVSFGSYNFRVHFRKDTNTGVHMMDYSLRVEPSVVTMPDAIMGKDYDQRIIDRQVREDDTCTAELYEGGLPEGLKLSSFLDGASGCEAPDARRFRVYVSGMADTQGTYEFTVRVQINNGEYFYSFRLNVSDAQGSSDFIGKKDRLVIGYAGEEYKDVITEFVLPSDGENVSDVSAVISGVMPDGTDVNKTETILDGDCVKIEIGVSGIPGKKGLYSLNVRYEIGDRTYSEKTYDLIIMSGVKGPEMITHNTSTNSYYWMHLDDGEYRCALSGNYPENATIEVQDMSLGMYIDVVMSDGKCAPNGRYIFDICVMTKNADPVYYTCVLNIVDYSADLGHIRPTSDTTVKMPLPVRPSKELQGYDILRMPDFIKVTEKDEKILEMSFEGEIQYRPCFILINLHYEDGDRLIMYCIDLMPTVKGDINEDGVVNTGDAVYVLKYSAGMIQLDNYGIDMADVNSDKTVNTGDAVLILKYSAGMIPDFV